MERKTSQQQQQPTTPTISFSKLDLNSVDLSKIVRPQQQKKLQLPTGFPEACHWAHQQLQDKSNGNKIDIIPGNDSQEKLSDEVIQRVQNLVERCLQLYMTKSEVVTALQLQANVEPSFTELVWDKLEEKNANFFKAYTIRLNIKDQITAFNYLVSQQAQVMQKNGYFGASKPRGVETQTTTSSAPQANTAQAVPEKAPEKKTRKRVTQRKQPPRYPPKPTKTKSRSKKSTTNSQESQVVPPIQPLPQTPIMLDQPTNQRQFYQQLPFNTQSPFPVSSPLIVPQFKNVQPDKTGSPKTDLDTNVFFSN